MQYTLLAYASPVFFFLIIVEVLVARNRGLQLHRLADCMTSMGCGIVTITVEVFLKLLLLASFNLIYLNYAVFKLDQQAVWVWIYCFLRRCDPLLYLLFADCTAIEACS